MKSTLMLLSVLLLLGMSLVPTGHFVNTTAMEEVENRVTSAALGSRFMKIPVLMDATVANASYADTNFGGGPQLFVGTGHDGDWTTGRAWFKFDLKNVPRELSIRAASMHVYLHDEWSVGLDEPIGVYYSANNTWDEFVITWNNQPSIAAVPTDVIDSPASPDMFVEGQWYEWDVTSDVQMALVEEQMLTEVLKQTVELGTQDSFKYLTSQEGFRLNATYIKLEYDTPEVSNLSVEGRSSGLLLDYIQDSNPELGWQFSDQNPSDFQKDFDVEVWDNEHYNGSLLWKHSHEEVWTIHNSFGESPDGNVHPFGLRNEFRIQMKYPASQLPRSGVVDKLYFTSSDLSATLQLEDLEISMLMTPDSADLTTALETNLGGRQPTVVVSEENYAASVDAGTLVFDVENTFFLDARMNLIVEIRLRNNTGDLIHLNRTLTGGPGSVATAWGEDSYLATTAVYASTRTYDLKIGFLTQKVFDATGGVYNVFPFGVDSGKPGRFQIKYNQSFVNRAGYIDRLYFRVNQLDTDVIYENFTVILCETPVTGPLGNVTWLDNYGGATPQVMLDEDIYVVRSLGRSLVIDLPNSFYYTNTHDLLIEFQWDSRVSGSGTVIRLGAVASSYRTWDVWWGGQHLADHGIAGYDLLIDFVNSEESVDLAGCITLVNETSYYWRVRACDSTGTWSNWENQAFTYRPLTAVPVFSAPWADPDPATVGREVTISINATYFLGMGPVSIEIGGANHSMSESGSIYSYVLTPSSAGNITYTIYMESIIGTTSSTSGVIQVNPAPPVDTTLLIIVGAAAVVIVVISVVFMKRKPAK